MADLNQALFNAQANAIFSAQTNFVAGLQEAVRQGAVASKQLQALAQALAADMVPESDRQAAFEQMGRNAQLSVQQAYTHRRYRRGTGSYRPETRYAGGKLLQALQSRDFYQASPNGLAFINRAVLDKYARQWRRLNYGAGAAAGGGPQTYNFELLAQASLGLEPDPRPAFFMPVGVWLEGGEFQPRSRHLTVPTRGIRASNFLDAGVRRIANDLGPTMVGLYRQFYDDAPSRVQFEQTLNVTAPRPRQLRFTRQY